MGICYHVVKMNVKDFEVAQPKSQHLQLPGDFRNCRDTIRSQAAGQPFFRVCSGAAPTPEITRPSSALSPWCSFPASRFFHAGAVGTHVNNCRHPQLTFGPCMTDACSHRNDLQPVTGPFTYHDPRGSPPCRSPSPSARDFSVHMDGICIQ